MLAVLSTWAARSAAECAAARHCSADSASVRQSCGRVCRAEAESIQACHYARFVCEQQG
jgi:hypothetical protein